MEDGAQKKLYEYKFKFASKPHHANLRTKQIVIDIIDITRWGLLDRTCKALAGKL